MKQKLALKAFMLLAFLTLIHSCIQEDLYVKDLAGKEYQSKSLWKEDEKYIKNVMAVYQENEGKIKKGNGSPLWDYAMTMDRFDESFLMVPVVENGKVTAVLNVPRKNQRVYFTYIQISNDLEFFQSLISDKIKKALPTEKSNAMAKLVCTTKTISMFYPDDESNPNGSGHWESTHVTECKNQQMDQCMGEVLPDGTCLGGSGSDPGYPYPGGGGENPDPQEDPCSKLKDQTQNQAFKNKVSELDKENVFNKDDETGFAVAYGPTTKYEPLAISSSDVLTFPPGNKYFGYIHTHLNKEGAVKIFSPADVFEFLSTCVRNAEQKGTMADAYGMVITSAGNYMLKYSGDGTYGIGPNQLKKWRIWYEKECNILLDKNEFTQPNIEKLFTQFLNEAVKIEGLGIYKVDKATGNTSKLQYNGATNPVQSNPCP